MPIISEPDLTDMRADREKQKTLNSTIDHQIAALDRMRLERRVRNKGHDPERREGFDRRARVAPAKT